MSCSNGNGTLCSPEAEFINTQLDMLEKDMCMGFWDAIGPNKKVKKEK